MDRLFKTIDLDNDNSLSASELRALVVGIRLEEINLDEDDAVEKVMKDFDTSGDALIDFDEFFNAIAKWLLQVKSSNIPSFDHFHEVFYDTIMVKIAIYPCLRFADARKYLMMQYNI